MYNVIDKEQLINAISDVVETFHHNTGITVKTINVNSVTDIDQLLITDVKIEMECNYGQTNPKSASIG